jgi:hypothetical protein
MRSYNYHPLKFVQNTINAALKRIDKDVDILNVVIIQKIDTITGKMTHVNLFSTDLTLGYAKIIDYYSLRF